MAAATYARILGSDKEREIDWTTVHKINYIHRHALWPLICRRTLLELLVEKEPVFKKGGKTYATSDLSDYFARIVRQYWMPFAAACVDELLVTGFVMYDFAELETGDMVPVVLRSENAGHASHPHMSSIGEYTVKVTYDRTMHRNKYTVYNLKDENGNPLAIPTVRETARVYAVMGFEPSADGSINSKLRPLIDQFAFIDALTEYELNTAYNASHPVLALQSSETISKQDPPLAIPFAGANREMAYRTKNGLYSNPANPDADMQDFVQKTNRHGMRRAHVIQDKLGDGYRVAPTYMNNILPLPPGYTTASLPTPQFYPGYEQALKNNEEEICCSYGLTRSLFVQDVSNRGQGNVMLTSDILRHTMDYWRDLLKSILTRVFAQLYGQGDFLSTASDLMQENPELVHAKPVHFFDVVKQLAEVTVSIPSTPMVDFDGMTKLFVTGIMPWEEFFANSRAASGLPPAKAPPPPNMEKFTEQLLASQGTAPKPDPKMSSAKKSSNSTTKKNKKKESSVPKKSAKS